MSQAEGVVKFIRSAAHAGASEAPDAELVRRFADSRDEHAFRAIVSRYGPVVWSVCRRLVRNHHDAEDAFQATFLVFARKAGGLRTGAAVGGWLHAVAYRIAARVRSSHREEASETEPTDGSPNGALDELSVREAEAVLHEELARLPTQYRDPLVLCCLEGLSRDEAAARLGWSANRVKHGLEQGRERLRARLLRRGIALGVPLLTGLLASPASAVPPPLAEAAARLATGPAPPKIDSLANGVARAMWVAKWKWAVVACAVLLLTTGGTLAAVLRHSPEPTSIPDAKPELVLAPVAVPDAPKPAPEPEQEPLREPIDIATAYLQHIIDGKPKQALKLADSNVTERHTKEIAVSGLKRVKVVLVLMNNARVQVVTERAKLVREPGAEAEDGHVVVILERQKTEGPWLIRDSDVVDEKRILREIDHYLEGDYNFKKPTPPEAKPGPDPPAPKDPIPARIVANDFLKLVQAEKDADALKLAVPGTLSENKVGEIRTAGYAPGITGPIFVAALVNDTRVEVVTDRQTLTLKEQKASGHLVLMLTLSKTREWQVKDIDFRDEDTIEQRVQQYLGGKYDAPAKK